ncbi:hypothetical protein LCGC14_0779130, partial [marine sediment metagenome]
NNGRQTLAELDEDFHSPVPLQRRAAGAFDHANR